ncbi:MAG: DUF502 domain-containing protein [Chitinophagaceae bacterium]|nr:DUF502 domain-containing protein [Chitinophagaceae bacterium]
MKPNYKEIGKRLLQLFLQGLVVLAPIGITVWAIVGLFNFIDDILPSLMHSIFPEWIKRNAEGNIDKIPGLGFIIVISLVLLVGWLSSLFMVGRLVELFDKVLEKTPGIKIIYSSVKDFFEAFAGDKKKFDKPVLVNIDSPDIWRIGFITLNDAENFDMKGYLVVYVPLSYAISGITYIVPKDKVRPLHHLSASEAMKFAVSGGVVGLEDNN